MWVKLMRLMYSTGPAEPGGQGAMAPQICVSSAGTAADCEVLDQGLHISNYRIVSRKRPYCTFGIGEAG